MIEAYIVSLNDVRFTGLNVRNKPSLNADVTRVFEDGRRVNIKAKFENEGEEWGLINSSKKNAPKEYVMMKYLTHCTENAYNGQ